MIWHFPDFRYGVQGDEMKIENKIWFGVIVGAVVVLLVSIIYFTATRPDKVDTDTTSIRVVLEGDEVEYQYTCYLDRLGGPVFDTSDSSIRDDQQQQKAISFLDYPMWGSIYIVGNHQDQDKFPTFDDKIIGHEVGDKYSFRFAKEEIIEYDDKLKVEIPITEKIPLYQTVTSERFAEMFEKEVPSNGLPLTHPLWKWDVIIESMEENGNIILYNQPAVGFKIDSLPWESDVVTLSSADGTITLKHDISNRTNLNTIINSFDYKHYNEKFYQLGSNWTVGRVTEMGPGNIIVDFNDERADRDVWFEVEIVEIL
jgi:FKBP-type peptidyl-prolyl cis-trans isomerase 2